MHDPSPGSPARARAIGFIVPSQRWLRRLRAALRRAEVPVGDLVLGDGSLRIRMLPGGTSEPGGQPPEGPGTEAPLEKAPLTLRVRPRATDEPGIATTRRFTVGYEGARRLDADELGWVSKLRALLQRLEEEIPPRLGGFGAIIAPTSSPEGDLRRLFPFLDVERSMSERGARVEVLLRAVSECNQACPFCSAPDHARPSSEALLGCFAAISRLLPGATLTFTGGEPTLRRRFIDEVQTARAAPGIGRVNVQSNAVLLADRHDPSELSPGPDLTFFVSLHAVEPAIYDACTGTKGQLPAALQGIRRLLEAGHGVTLNTVVSRLNLEHLPTLLRSLPALFPGPNPPALHFSSLMCPERKPEAAALLARYRDLAPALIEAVQLGRELGYEVESLLSSTHASMPTCTLPEPMRAGRALARIEAHETGYEEEGKAWMKAEGCRACPATEHCLGVPRPYASRFGLEELIPLDEIPLGEV